MRSAPNRAQSPSIPSPRRIRTSSACDVPFISNTDDQLLQLFLHTQEDALLAGLTTSNGRTLPIEGRMSRNLYAIQDDGTLRWYRNDGQVEAGGGVDWSEHRRDWLG